MPKARGLDWETEFCWVSEKGAHNPQRNKTIEVWTRGSARCKCRLPIRSSCSRVWPGTWEGRDAKDAKTCMQWNLQRGPSSTEYLDIYISNLVLHFLSGVLIGMHVWKKQTHRTNRNRLCNYFHKGDISLFFGEGARTLLHGKEMKKWTCLDKDHTSSKVAAADLARCVSKREIQLCFASSAEAGCPESKSCDSVLKRSTLDFSRRRLSAASARSLVPSRCYFLCRRSSLHLNLVGKQTNLQKRLSSNTSSCNKARAISLYGEKP